jgi:hypothetical protein
MTLPTVYGGLLIMRKTMTMMMTFLMLASVLINIGGSELEQVEIDESSGRAAEANLTTVLSPRATVTEFDGTKRGAILAGEGTQFDIVVLNEGDASITEMNIVVTVYLTGGNIAQDASGNDLQWTDSVICDWAASCEFASLGANSYLGGGAYTVKTLDPATQLREPVVWVPIVGNYELVFSLEIAESSQDSISSNNELLVPVSVVDWFDIEVDLAWDSGKEAESGPEDKPFTLTISLNGSSSWDARNISIALSASGDGLESATGDPGGEDADLTAGHSIIAGTLNSSAIIWQDMSDDANASAADFQEFGSRYELNWGETFTYSGVADPDSAIASGTYEVTAVLESFLVFAQKPECAREENVTIDDMGTPGDTSDDIIETMQVIHMCDEGVYVADDVNANSEDEIMGGVTNFHDISVVDLTVLQGYDMGGNNPSYFFKDGDTLSVGYSRIMVEVTHRGSDTTEHYDWQVDISIADYMGVEVATYTADSCVNGMPSGMSYSHKLLGAGDLAAADLSGIACPEHDFGNGEFTVTATVSMVGGTTDMASSNDDITANFVAFNNIPVVSMALETTGDIMTGDIVTFTLSAYDDDCPGGECLSFNWSRMRSDGTVDEMAMCDTDDTVPGSGWACDSMAGPDWTGSNAVWVIATDGIGGESDPSYTFPHVWNRIVVSASSGDVDMTYSITTDMLTELTFNITDVTQLTSVSLPGHPNSFTSEVAVDYNPSISYIPENVLEQSFTIVFEGDSEGAYSLWYQPASVWQHLSDEVDSHNSTHVMMNVSDFGGGTLGAGTLAVFEGAEAGDPPSATISTFNAVAVGGGDVELTWDFSGTMTPNDSFKILVDGIEVDSLASTSDRVWRDKGLDHGESHDYGVKICNAIGCNPTEGSKSGVAANNEVDPASGAGSPSFTENTTHILVEWTFTNTSDVDQWVVCWDETTFDANAVGLGQISCESTGSTDASYAIAKKTPAGTHNMYVSVGGVDDLGNSEESGQMGNTQYVNAQDLDIDSGDQVGSGGDETLPSWAWPAIIGVVVIAFVAGAFILSRGGDGDDNKDWDY